MKHRVALALSLISLAVLAGCGGSGSSTPPTSSQPLSKNWQLTLADQIDPTSGADFTGGLTGGFLLQTGKTVAGSFNYAIAPAGTVPCAGGAASVSGTVSGQSVTLNVVAGGQTFTLMGTLSSDGTSMMGNYTTSAGVPVSGGGVCGAAQTGATWSAVAIPAITGTFQGDIHNGSVYQLTGNLLQGPNVGAAGATVTGELISANDPCFVHASVTGTISGSSVLLSVIADNGAVLGQIGTTGGTAATFGNAGGGGGLVLRGINGGGFSTSSKCSAGGGNVCLGTLAANCAQPVSFSFSSIAFPPQLVGSSRSQTVTLTNTDPSGTSQSGTLTFNVGSSEFGIVPAPNFSAQGNAPCPSALPPGTAEPFTLVPNQSCTITLTFTPQQSCTWGPNKDENNPNNVPPLKCPAPLPPASLIADVASSPDGDTSFMEVISGTGLSAIEPVEAQLGFSAIAQGQTSPQQILTLVNSSASPVTILPAVSGTTCVPGPITVPRAPGAVPGLQIVTQGSLVLPATYACDLDSVSGLPNFPISSDNCTGVTLGPGKSCTFEVTFTPQPGIANANDLTTNDSDYFIQLSTLQCAGAVTSSCEIDSGRFPIDIKWNNQSPLRISPSGGFDFGIQVIGTDTVQSFTVQNDATDPAFITPTNPSGTTVEIVGISTSASSGFSQTNTCGSSLAPGANCTITVIFHPTGASLAQDIVVIQPKDPLSEGIAQRIYVWGRGQ